MEENDIKSLFFYFLDLKTEFKNLVSIKSYGWLFENATKNLKFCIKDADVNNPTGTWKVITEVVAQRCSVKKVFFKILQN